MKKTIIAGATAILSLLLILSVVSAFSPVSLTNPLKPGKTHDLALTNLQISGGPYQEGVPIKIEVTIKNFGDFPESVCFSFGMIGPSYGHGAGACDMFTLNSGEEYSFDFTNTPQESGKFELKAETNAHNLISPDVNPKNNEKSLTFYVSERTAIVL